ncbi:hypothetical protein CEUSTIGMA_g13825.t1 [Chlamydomonas eustigma]|uniref:RAP domain-containing protein n=1 Tax=Chlamydomonas eustigma TaxID=1157962 RepID=A0A250XTL9_9CHLO|nr:hypothetical protein CEUSTIGMA_g13825.t1 [Chlamydomonas eustigma]|eukprot:GAX86415.1 hypothetical protein CEUSTIGMA_g13825.t1 [Chlamydomonas eustigma]
MCGQATVLPMFITATHANEIEQWLLQLQETTIPGLRFKVLTAETQESSKRQISENFGEILGTLDVFVCSPSITAGPSFELKHFDHMVQFAVNNGTSGCTVDALLQQSARVRILGSDDSPNDCIDVYVSDPPHPPKPLDSEELDLYLQNCQDDVFAYVPTSVITAASTDELNNHSVVFRTNSLAYACLKGCMYMLHKSMVHFVPIIVSSLQEYGVEVTITEFDGGSTSESLKSHAKQLRDSLSQRRKTEVDQVLRGARSRSHLTQTEFDEMDRQVKCTSKAEVSNVMKQLIYEYRYCVLRYRVDLDDVHNDLEFMKKYVGSYEIKGERTRMNSQCRRLLMFEWASSNTTAKMSSQLIFERRTKASEDNSEMSLHIDQSINTWKPAAIVGAHLLDLLVPSWRSDVTNGTPLSFTPSSCVDTLRKWLKALGPSKYAKLKKDMKMYKIRSYSELTKLVNSSDLPSADVRICRSSVDLILSLIFGCKGVPGANNDRTLDLTLYTDMVKRRAVVDTSSKSEQRFTQALESQTGLKFKKIRPLWLINPLTSHPLELDLFCEEKHVAIEYDGPQHYTFPNVYHRTREEFDAQVLRDQAKDSLCRMHGVVLIRIRCIGDLNSEVDEALLELKKIGIT